MVQPWRIVDRGGQRDTLGEGLLWSERDNALYWTDILAPALNRLSLDDNGVKRWAMPHCLGWVIERRGRPGFVAGFQNGICELALEPLTIRLLIDPEPHLPGNRLNDAKADAKGRIWAGSMPFGADQLCGSLYRLDANQSLHVMDEGYAVTNGPAFSPDQRWLYHTDTMRRLVYRFALHEDGTLGTREPFITFAPDWGYPDGMTVDSEGHLWIAHWGGGRVSRFSPAGILEKGIALPASQITNVCFAGAGLARLFVTSAAKDREDEPLAGALFEILEPGVRGLPPGQFAG